MLQKQVLQHVILHKDNCQKCFMSISALAAARELALSAMSGSGDELSNAHTWSARFCTADGKVDYMVRLSPRFARTQPLS